MTFTQKFVGVAAVVVVTAAILESKDCRAVCQTIFGPINAQAARALASLLIATIVAG